MTESHVTVEPFAVRDCALVAIATGKRAGNLSELRDQLLDIHQGSLYYHFWGMLLRPRFDDPQFNNDFAVWSHYALHDNILAERLAVIDPKEFYDLEALRRELIEIIEQRLEEIHSPEWVGPGRHFHFIRSQIVVFDSGWRIDRPENLPNLVLKMSLGSIFYHFIDARRRHSEGIDDFRAWLKGFGDQYRPACAGLASIDPYFATLVELRRKIGSALRHAFERRSDAEY
jgi:hypothetical protein